MASNLKLLCIHGLGDHRNYPWQPEWEQAIRESFPKGNEVGLEIDFFTYDDIFEKIELSAWDYAKALAKLTASGIGSWFGRKSRGLFDSASHYLKWYAGYVVAWVENEKFRTTVRKRLHTKVKDYKPDVVLAHSLGSLVSYDAFSSQEAKQTALRNRLKNLTYVTLGSQIANPFVVSNLMPGRIDPLDVRFWFHLYNKEDDVFTAPIRLPGVANFRQVNTFFDIKGFADHSATEYIKHGATINQVWRPLSVQATATEEDTGAVKAFRSLAFAPPAKRKPRRRALLIGINEYPTPEHCLEGCVNDVFLMSEVLQECGFTSNEIRVCLNHRATADGILERMHWLLDDVEAGDELVYYYSGHGARLPTYGEGDAVDHMDESLVPYDFDWSPERCVTDDQIYGLYSQLPYETRLAMIFDCCHSGGMHRNGSFKARGIDPPDDIRHRALSWDADKSMWVARELRQFNEEFTTDESLQEQFCGKAGNVSRLGRAMPLRSMPKREYDRLAKKSKGKPIGPYLPLIVQACQEDQYAYEYRHGATSYGAFTYSLANILRTQKKISFGKLVNSAGKRLADLGYDQAPEVLGPQAVIGANVPWRRKK